MIASNRPATPGSLRDWLDHLSQHDRLAVVREGRALRFEVAAIANRFDGHKATLFPKPGGHAVPVVSGLLSDRAWVADAMGAEPSEVLTRFEDASLNPLASEEVVDAACQEEVNRSPDLTSDLPIPTHNELDSGAYISAGLMISRNPVNGIQNVSIHRLQISGPDRMGVLLLPRHTLAYQQMAAEAGEDLPVAVVIGVDPLTLLASQAIVPLDHDELEIAGALHGRPLPVVKCLTSEVRVPAQAEIVIEGRLLAEAREPEGPFGEFPQYYGDRANRHVMAVDAITTRTRPIFHTIVGGGLEHLLLGAIPREATILAHLRRSFPGVMDVRLGRGGVMRYHLAVKYRKRNEGEAKNVIMGAFAAHYDIKQVIVVDPDVDIHDPVEVEWAVATRFQADRDLLVVSNTLGSKLDPSTVDGLGAKMGLDATIPLDAPEGRYTRIRVPGEDAVDKDAMTTGNDWRAAAGES
ncbi:MAG: UbiD family decarboxylase [Alphaproteobacteria bacterium]